ncbi:hypothetical protein [Paenibacillus sp. Marseille-Q9583]
MNELKCRLEESYSDLLVNPDSLLHFYSWLKPLKNNATAILFVRCDVAFDIPLPISELFTLSLTGRNMRTWKGTGYSNKKHQRQVAGYSRVYDKKRQRMKRYGQVTQGELTRFEVVYVPVRDFTHTGGMSAVNGENKK